MTEGAAQALARALRSPEAELNLGRAALLIARAEYPGLDVGHYLDRLDALARSIAPEVAREEDAAHRLDLLSRFLFISEGFRGNADQYYDPRNSYLNDVLDRKLGIPITLSTIFMEVARRLGLPIVGVGFPGHFLVKYVHRDGEILIDPFHRGAILTPRECRRRLEEMAGGSVPFRAEHLRAVSKAQILFRMLTNLKHIYVRARNFPKALRILDLLLVVDPGAAPDVRDRGLLLSQVGCPGAALHDLERYVAMAPEAEDAEAMAKQVAGIRRRIASLN